jgi:hypothetical protein
MLWLPFHHICKYKTSYRVSQIFCEVFIKIIACARSSYLINLSMKLHSCARVRRDEIACVSHVSMRHYNLMYLLEQPYRNKFRILTTEMPLSKFAQYMHIVRSAFLPLKKDRRRGVDHCGRNNTLPDFIILIKKAPNRTTTRG